MYRIGVDEVGRGPLAGPVLVAAVALPRGMKLPKSLGSLRDSKKLTAAARERWAAWIKENLPYAIARSAAKTIDARGISVCANACALRCYSAVVSAIGEAPVRLDGGLFLKSKKNQAAYPNAVTSPKADEDFPEVALASILAKVTRDAMMTRYHKTYPEYGFGQHAGYGTKAHYAAIQAHGTSPVHRLTFLGSLGTMRT